MKISGWTLALLLCLLAGVSAAQTVAFSFDDPRDPADEGQASVSSSILLSLKQAGLKSTLFVCGMRVDSPTGIAIVKAWQTAGHEIGNHTYSHQNYSGAISFAEFAADAEKNEKFLVSNGIHPTRFRFPYLKEGDTLEKRDQMRGWLEKRHYRSGAVGIDASDWYYDKRFAELGLIPASTIAAFKSAYLAHIMDRAHYYHHLGEKHLGRAPALVLLLHVNRINALFLDDMISMFRAKGWNVVDTETAYKDPIYRARPDIVPAGESVIWQLAKERKDPTLRDPGEAGAYEKPILDRLGLRGPD